jgi:hypothetical protein
MYSVWHNCVFSLLLLLLLLSLLLLLLATSLGLKSALSGQYSHKKNKILVHTVQNRQFCGIPLHSLVVFTIITSL